MRISTQIFYNRNNDSMMNQQAKLSQQNVHLSTGKRVIHGADDAVAISTIKRIKQDISSGEQYIENGKIAETANAMGETAIGQATNILQRARELMVSAGNAIYNAENYETVAIELEGLRDELIGVANTQDGNSQYIFSGYEVDTQPFQKNEFGAVDYHGDNGNQTYQVGAGVFVQGTDSGTAVFIDIPEGNGSFVSEANINNQGSGVIDSASVIDGRQAAFLKEDYSIAISVAAEGAEPDYSVYGIKEGNVRGDAKINLSSIDLSDPGFAAFDPALFDKAASNGATIGFSAAGSLLEVTVNGVSASPAAIFDPANSQKQTVTLNGFSFDIEGQPNVTDTYTLNKYIEPTQYTEDQSIEFNGIKTSLKGNLVNKDAFILRQSGSKDIFSTLQNAIDTLRMPGDDDNSDAQREIRLDMARHEIDNNISNVSMVRTAVGARMRTIDNQRESTFDFNLTNQKTLSNLEDLDMASAISEYQQQLGLLEVSQKTFMQLQGLSLFKLL